MQRNRRKPVVARRSLPKEQAKLDGFFVLKVPTLGASNLIKPFFPTTKGLFELKHGDEGDIVEPEYLEEDSGDGDGEVDASLRPGVGIGDGIGSDEPESAEEVGFEGMSNSKYEAVPHLIYKHDADQHSKRQKSLYDGYEDESVIRCPCKNNVDYGLMIQCETCDVWQHSICVGIRHQTNVPTHYYCEICHPRNFNCTCNKGEPIGKFLQCTICKTWQHAACVGVIRDPYSCLRCASSSSRKPFSSEEGAVRPRSGLARRGIGNKDEGIIGSKRGKRYSPPTSEHDATYTSYESTTHASTSAEAPSSITPQEAATNPPLIQTKKLDTLGALYSFVTDSLLKQNFEMDHLHLHQYGYGNEESARDSEFSVHHRQMLVKYSVEFSRTYISNSRAQDEIIQGLSILLKESTQAVLTSMAKLAHELQAIDQHEYVRQGMQTPWTEVSANTCDAKVIHTLAPASWEDGDGVGVEVETGRALIKKEVASGLLIGEFCGNAVEEVQVQREFVIADDILIQPPGPFILFLASIHIAVDARKYGSLLRFARRSCMPNTTINFGEDGGQLKVGLFAIKQITADTEITIPFDYPYQILNNPIECACGNSSSCSVAMWFSQCLSTGMHLQQVLVSYHNDIVTPFAQPSESDDEEENDPGEHAELGDGTKPFSKGLREHKRRRSSGVKMLESTLTPYTPPSDKLTREQRKLQAVMLSFEKMEKGKKLKKEEAQQERRWKRKPRDGVAPTSDNFGNSNNNTLINANSSTREWRSRHTRKHVQDENPTNVSPSPTTNLPLSSANSLASLSVKVPYSTGKKAWLQELSFNSVNNTS